MNPSSTVTEAGSKVEQRPHVSFLLPCYNEGAVLPEMYRRVKAVAASLGRATEIIFVDDGSTDDTKHQLLSFAIRDESVVVVELSRNHGHQLALSAGLHYCRGERVLILDADLQDPPELLPQMLALMDGGFDVVYAQRRSRRGDHTFKRVACAVFYRLVSRLADTPIPLDTGDFRLVSRRVLELLLQMPERHRFIRGMVSWVGFRQTPLVYDRDPRFAGKTKYPFYRLMKLALDGIAASSTRPLALASYAGLAFSAASLILVAYALYSWLWVGQTPQGWTSLMITVTAMGGVQLLVLGIMGQYLGRMHEQLRGRPLFIVNTVVRGSDKGNALHMLWASSFCPPRGDNTPGAETFEKAVASGESSKQEVFEIQEQTNDEKFGLQSSSGSRAEPRAEKEKESSPDKQHRDFDILD